MTVYYRDDNVTLHGGDCLDVLAELPDNSVDSVCTDPPYGLEFMGKQWDRLGDIGQASHGGFTDGSGFKGFRLASYNASANIKCQRCNKWQYDHVGRKCECGPDAIWPNVKAQQGRAMQAWHHAWVDQCLRVLKPGGHLLAFGGTRTHHRLASAIEDAGFEIRDSIAWLYGSGFPKSLDVSKAIDKQRNEDRAPVDTVRVWLNEKRLAAGFSHDAVNKHFGHANNGGGSSSSWMTNPTSKSLPTWGQWQELKRLFGFPDDMDAEVWRLNGRKGQPGDAWDQREFVGQKTAAIATPGDVDRYTVGGSRSVVVDITAPATDAARQWQGWGTALKPAFEPIVVARKPLSGTVAANVLAHGTGALNIDACRVGGNEDTARRQGKDIRGGNWSGNGGRSELITGGGTGRWPANVVLDGDMADELDQQSGTSASNIRQVNGNDHTRSDSYTPDRGAGGERGHTDSGGASRFFPTFRYTAKAATAQRPSVDGVSHPTVKPLELMRWLVRLVTPPHGIVLDPFAGSGTTGEAAIHEHMHAVLIEREPTYLPLIVARLSKPMEVGFDFDPVGEHIAATMFTPGGTAAYEPIPLNYDGEAPA